MRTKTQMTQSCNQYSEIETKIWRQNILNQFNRVSSSCLRSHFVISLIKSLRQKCLSPVFSKFNRQEAANCCLFVRIKRLYLVLKFETNPNCRFGNVLQMLACVYKFYFQLRSKIWVGSHFENEINITSYE